MTPFLAKAILTTLFILVGVALLVFHRLSRRKIEGNDD